MCKPCTGVGLDGSREILALPGAARPRLVRSGARGDPPGRTMLVARGREAGSGGDVRAYTTLPAITGAASTARSGAGRVGGQLSADLHGIDSRTAP